MLFASRRTREQMAFLILFLTAEVLLAAIVVYSSLNEDVDVPEWQVVLFGIVLIWIYIWYLKGRERDVRERTIDERIKAHTLIECMPQGILILEEDGRILAWNAAATRSLGSPGGSGGPRRIGQFLDSASSEALSRHGFGDLSVRLQDGRAVTLFVVPLKEGAGPHERIVLFREP